MDDSDICIICQNSINADKSVHTVCDHRFCSECFFTWLKTKANCPVCRREFTSRRHQTIRNHEEYLEDLQEECRRMETYRTDLARECETLGNDVLGKVNLYNVEVGKLNRIRTSILRQDHYFKQRQHTLQRLRQYRNEWTGLNMAKVEARRRRFGMKF